jgi:hypothetical protein
MSTVLSVNSGWIGEFRYCTRGDWSVYSEQKIKSNLAHYRLDQGKHYREAV